MFDSTKVSLGIAPIGWCNDDMPELGGECTFRQIVSEMALAGFSGCEIGNKYPSDAETLKRELELRGMRIASRWFSSFILTQSIEQVRSDFLRELNFLAAVGANRINVSEQSYSIQGQMDTPVLADRRHIMNDREWRRLCEGLNHLGKLARSAALSCASTTTWAPWFRRLRRPIVFWRTPIPNTYSCATTPATLPLLARIR